MAFKNEHIPYALWKYDHYLDDVVQISKLSIEGDVIVGSFDITNKDNVKLVYTCLGVESSVIEHDLKKQRSSDKDSMDKNKSLEKR